MCFFGGIHSGHPAWNRHGIIALNDMVPCMETHGNSCYVGFAVLCNFTVCHPKNAIGPWLLLWRGVLSRAGGGGGGLGVFYLFCLPACFQVPARSTILIYSICYCKFSKSLRNFVPLSAGRYKSINGSTGVLVHSVVLERCTWNGSNRMRYIRTLDF